VREDRELPTAHLSDDELFALSLPTTAAPEPLPSHLLDCLRCSRVMADWKSALHDLAEEDEAAVDRRSPEEWRNAGDATLESIRRSGPPGRSRVRTLAWALPVAASLFLVAVFAVRRPSAPVSFDDTAGLSAQDRADDALLRDVDQMASGDESAAGWSTLAPVADDSDSAPAAEAGS
jgi:hypothetical protein